MNIKYFENKFIELLVSLLSKVKTLLFNCFDSIILIK